MKHTPGPWKASANGQIFGGRYNTTVVAETGWCFWTNRLHELMQEETCPDDVQDFLRKNIVESQSNAKLIAAAPLMAQELKETADWLITISAQVFGIDGPELRNSLRNQGDYLHRVVKQATE